MKRPKTYSNIFPRQAVRVYNGPKDVITIHELCSYCRGRGKETVWTSSSNNPGYSTGRETRKDCTYCKGTGYESAPIEIDPVVIYDPAAKLKHQRRKGKKITK